MNLNYDWWTQLFYDKHIIKSQTTRRMNNNLHLSRLLSITSLFPKIRVNYLWFGVLIRGGHKLLKYNQCFHSFIIYINWSETLCFHGGEDRIRSFRTCCQKATNCINWTLLPELCKLLSEYMTIVASLPPPRPHSTHSFGARCEGHPDPLPPNLQWMGSS